MRRASDVSPRVRVTHWLLACPALALTACARSPSPLLPGGQDARSVASLTWFMIALMSVVAVITIALVIIGALRNGGTLAEHLPINTNDGKRWIHIGGLAFPLVTLIVVFVFTVGTLRSYPLSHASTDPTIEVIGHQWWWEVRYLSGDLQQTVTTANEIHIPVGRSVEVRLISDDVIHSFWVPQLHGKMDMIPGRVTAIRLKALTAGSYRGQCAEYCGDQHAHMAFFVIAEPQTQFDEWLRVQRLPAPQPADSLAARGQQLFVGRACALCHTIRGTDAGGQVAPDLTHFGSRSTIAAGTLPNNVGALEAWIVNAPSVKPGTRMPAMNQFTGADVGALATYLESLK